MSKAHNNARHRVRQAAGDPGQTIDGGRGMSAAITSAATVRQLVDAGWELWLIASSPLPGRWELRLRSETRAVHWDAIALIRRHYREWFLANTEEIQIGRYTWVYRPRQTVISA